MHMLIKINKPTASGLFCSKHILLWVSIFSFQYKKFNLNTMSLLIKIYPFLYS